jgi:uncharacterized cupredoxin-like copper-binding protein
MDRATKMVTIGSALVMIVGLAACGDDDDDASGDEGGGASVSVVLAEFIVAPDPSSVVAGEVEFVAENVGADVHELVIVKGDDPASLPVDGDGVVIEDDLPAGDFVGEIALVDPGAEGSASFDLDAGSYILFCNILTQIGTGGSHFQEGMVNTLTVT